MSNGCQGLSEALAYGLGMPGARKPKGFASKNHWRVWTGKTQSGWQYFRDLDKARAAAAEQAKVEDHVWFERRISGNRWEACQ